VVESICKKCNLRICVTILGNVDMNMCSLVGLGMPITQITKCSHFESIPPNDCIEESKEGFNEKMNDDVKPRKCLTCGKMKCKVHTKEVVGK